MGKITKNAAEQLERIERYSSVRKVAAIANGRSSIFGTTNICTKLPTLFPSNLFSHASERLEFVGYWSVVFLK